MTTNNEENNNKELNHELLANQFFNSLYFLRFVNKFYFN